MKDDLPTHAANRRDVLKATGGLVGGVIIFGIGSTNVGAEVVKEVTIEPGTTIEFDGQTSGWVGIAPDEIEGEANPTLVLKEGEEYNIGWSEGDGSMHNIEIWDEDDEVVDDLETELEQEGGDNQFLEFEASDEMAHYLCEPHKGTMFGDLVVEPSEKSIIEPDTTIEFDGQTSGWVGIAPDEIEGEANPTLVLKEGEEYEIGWSEGDGAIHNIVIWDDDRDVVGDLATKLVAEPGDDQFLKFEASGEMAYYLCEPYEGTMFGDIVVKPSEKFVIEPGTTIELNGQTSGWVGIAPDEIEGEANPTLVLKEGEEYEIGWSEGDGSMHNIEIWDEDDEVVDDLETELEQEGGDDQFLEFEASGEMAHYICGPHLTTMSGDIVVEPSENDEGLLAERTIDQTEVEPGDSTEVTISVDLEEPVDQIVWNVGFEPTFADVSTVDMDGADFPLVDEEGGLAAWADVVSIEFVYEVIVPDDAEHGDVFMFDGKIEHEAAGFSVGGDEKIEVDNGRPSLEDYTNEDGDAETDELREAINDWRDGEINTDLLRDVIDSWRS